MGANHQGIRSSRRLTRGAALFAACVSCSVVAQDEAHNVRLIPDGNGEFTAGMGMLVDKSDLGFGRRSWRYSMLVKNGVDGTVKIDTGRLATVAEMLGIAADMLNRRTVTTAYAQGGGQTGESLQSLLELRKFKMNFGSFRDILPK